MGYCRKLSGVGESGLLAQIPGGKNILCLEWESVIEFNSRLIQYGILKKPVTYIYDNEDAKQPVMNQVPFRCHATLHAPTHTPTQILPVRSASESVESSYETSATVEKSKCRIHFCMTLA